MSFQVIELNDRFRPTVTCDLCKSTIGDWDDANIEYVPNQTKGFPSPIVILHKKCSHVRHVNSFQQTHWMGFRDYLTWLLANNKWGTERGGKLTIKIHEPLGM